MYRCCTGALSLGNSQRQAYVGKEHFPDFQRIDDVHEMQETSEISSPKKNGSN